MADELFKDPTPDPVFAEVPVVKAYVCNRWPQLKIGNDQVQFLNGKFTTGDPVLQQLVESSNDFGRFIIPQQ